MIFTGKTMWVGGKTLVRVPFRGVATRVNAYVACQKYNMVPVLDHSHYKHYGREAWGYRGWHFSHPHHNMHYGVPIYKVELRALHVSLVQHCSECANATPIVVAGCWCILLLWWCTQRLDASKSGLPQSVHSPCIFF